MTKQDDTRDITDAIQKINMKIKRLENKYTVGNNEEWLIDDMMTLVFCVHSYADWEISLIRSNI